ncbi:MAG TPA: ABC transporter substrate-binding protein [Acidimicrobiales bacterium]
MTRGSRHRRSAISAVVIALALVAAACGSSSKSSSSSGTTLPKPTGTPLKIGWIGTITTATGAAPNGGKDALDAWVQSTNASGGVNGHPVTAVYADDKGDPAVGLAAMKDLVENQHVIAIVGENAGSTDQTWGPYMVTKQVPVVNGYAGDALAFTNPMFFLTAGAVTANLWGQMESASKAGATRVGILLCTESPACAQAQPLFDLQAKAVGLTMVANLLASATQASYTAECLTFKNGNAQAVAAFVNLNVFVRDCARQNYNPITINSNLLPNLNTIKASPELIGGTISGSSEQWPCVDPKAPGAPALYTALKTYHPDWAPGGKNNALFSSDICASWAGGLAFAKAIQNAAVASGATATSADVIRGLSMFKNETLGGVAPNSTFNDGTKPNPLNPCVFLYKWVKGVFQSVPGPDAIYTCKPAA